MADITKTLSLTDAAELLGVHYMTAYRYVRTGRLPATKAGAEWRVSPADVATLLEPAPDAPPDSPGGKRRRTAYEARLEERLVRGDEAGSWAVVESAMASGMGPDAVYTDVIAPAMTSIGDKWAHGELSVAEEHIASAVVLRLIGRLGPRFTRRGRKRGSVVIGAPPGDAHGIPSAMAADLLRAQGFEVIDLGADVPALSFADTVRSASRLVAVGVVVTTPDNDENVHETLLAVRSATDAPAIVGGTAVTGADHAIALGATAFSGSVEEMIELVLATATSPASVD